MMSKRFITIRVKWSPVTVLGTVNIQIRFDYRK